jgi:nucleolar protein 16
LNAPTGGVERPKGVDAATAAKQTSDSLYINGNAKPGVQVDTEEVRVERDPKTGKILRVISDSGDDDDEIQIAGQKRKRSNPLGDPLNDIENSQSHPQPGGGSQSDFIRSLELRVAHDQDVVKKRRPRQQSKREEEWIERLVERHGDNIAAMVRDKKLNPMQQTEGDLRRRIRKWKERQSA